MNTLKRNNINFASKAFRWAVAKQLYSDLWESYQLLLEHINCCKSEWDDKEYDHLSEFWEWDELENLCDGMEQDLGDIESMCDAHDSEKYARHEQYELTVKQLQPLLLRRLTQYNFGMDQQGEICQAVENSLFDLIINPMKHREKIKAKVKKKAVDENEKKAE